jgi:hypothetical protein
MVVVLSGVGFDDRTATEPIDRVTADLETEFAAAGLNAM